MVVEKHAIEAGLWLGDDHMYAAHKLLSQQYPHLQGMQSTLLCQNCGFTPVISDGVFVYVCNLYNHI